MRRASMMTPRCRHSADGGRDESPISRSAVSRFEGLGAAYIMTVLSMLHLTLLVVNYLSAEEAHFDKAAAASV